QEQRAHRKEQLIQELREGEVRRGRVTSLTDFGAFVDVGGADGLVHISELAWGTVGTCVGVGISFAVGLAFAHRYMRETVSLSLVRTLAVPAAAALASLGTCTLVTRVAQLDALPLFARVVCRGTLAAGVFFLVMLALQRQRLVAAAGQVWRLLAPA
ncbi:MAG: S1 RNA-binding domain-containing protein, partial [Anaerolineae bacterium]|nr:S1 RNA-binding domain-containing protein [Anaerolineae bacterium]